jgi:hypothetical protein
MAAPFVSRQDLSDYLGRNVNSDEGALIAVDAACEIVRTYAEQTFNQGTDTITMDGTGTDALLLPELPVSAAGTVTVGGTLAGTADYKLNGGGVLFRVSNPDATGWQNCAGSLTWPTGRQNIEVTYDHGYADDDLPRDVRVVALMIASRLLVQGVASSEGIQGDTITYATPATDLTEGEKAILRKYKVAR